MPAGADGPDRLVGRVDVGVAVDVGNPAADRYRFPDLLRLFAAEQLAEEDDLAHIMAARDRDARWALRRAAAAALRFDADHDHTAALTAARAAPEAAPEVGDDLQVGWALGYEAEALHRLGRNDETIARLREAAAHLGNQTCAQSRLANELTTLNAFGQQLRQAGSAHEALTIHRRLS
nr:hypothetical protein OG409_37540 [Streptomyces sp. NBC_00974]